MKEMIKNAKCCSTAEKAWLAFGGLLALGLTLLFIREIPSLRRELRIMKM
jgi:hypothetical protein